MRNELLFWESALINNNPIRLRDDKAGASTAEYFANNQDEKLLICYEPEKAESGCVHCDYLLVHKSMGGDAIRFIELKGGDVLPRKGEKLCTKGCPQTWAHAFHQLLATYERCESYIDDNDIVKMILCTSWEKNHKKPYARYKQYTQYRAIREIKRFDIEPQILYCTCEDNI